MEELNDIALAFREGKKEGLEQAAERIFTAIMNWAGTCPSCGEPVDLVKIAKTAFVTDSPTPPDFDEDLL